MCSYPILMDQGLWDSIKLPGNGSNWLESAFMVGCLLFSLRSDPLLWCLCYCILTIRIYLSKHPWDQNSTTRCRILYQKLGCALKEVFFIGWDNCYLLDLQAVHLPSALPLRFQNDADPHLVWPCLHFTIHMICDCRWCNQQSNNKPV